MFTNNLTPSHDTEHQVAGIRTCYHDLTFAALSAGKTEAKLATKPADLKKKRKKGGIRIRKGVVVQACCAQPSAGLASLAPISPAVLTATNARRSCCAW